MYTCSIFVKCFYNIHISIKFNHSNLEKHIKIIKKSYLEHNFNQILNNQLMVFKTLLSKIILVEGIKDVEEIKSIYSSTVKVISFDYEAHKLLNELNIKHELVEDYFSPQDEYDIDTKALELTTQWYKHKSIIELNYQGLNLGSLLEIELIGYFFEQLKRVLGIIRVIEKEKPDIIVAYFLGEIAETMCRQKKIKIQKYESKKSVELFFDSIDIPIKVGGRIFSIKISQKKFQIITKMLNQTICSLFGFKPDYNNLRIKKTILLSEYNLSTYDYLVEELSNSKNNIYLLNQRRPAIWNYHSFQIMRKSKCKIIDLDDFINKDIKIEIKKEQKKFEDNIKTLWNDNNIFVEMFSINDYSFWNGIKNNFTQLVTKRFVEAIKKIFLLNELFKNIDISCILEWAHVGLEDKLIISIANKRKIPNLFLQHGLYLQNEKLKKYVPILPILPYNSSKHLVWGNIMERFVLEYGIRQDMVIKIGSPRHDKFFRKEHIKKLDTVLLAANGFFHVNFKGTDTRSFIKMENFVRKIFEVMKKYPKIKLIVKLHPGKVSFDIKPLIKQLDLNVKIFQSENIMDLLENCDYMISLNYSTVTLDAMISKKPILVLLPEEQNYENEIPLKNNAVLFTSDLNQIESLMDNLFNNKEICHNLVKKGNEFVNEYVANQGKSSHELAKILDMYD